MDGPIYFYLCPRPWRVLGSRESVSRQRRTGVGLASFTGTCSSSVTHRFSLLRDVLQEPWTLTVWCCQKMSRIIIVLFYIFNKCGIYILYDPYLFNCLNYNNYKDNNTNTDKYDLNIIIIVINSNTKIIFILLSSSSSLSSSSLLLL